MNYEEEDVMEYEEEYLMSVKDWLKIFLLMMIPFANIVFLIKWALGKGDINRNVVNWVRAYLVFAICIFGFVVVLCILGMAHFTCQGNVKTPNGAYSIGDTNKTKIEKTDYSSDYTDLSISGLSVRVPGNWVQEEDESENVIFASDSDGYTCTVSVSSVASDASEDELREMLDYLVEDTDALDSDSVIDLAGRSYKYAVTGSDDAKTLTFAELVSVGYENYALVTISKDNFDEAEYKSVSDCLDLVSEIEWK